MKYKHILVVLINMLMIYLVMTYFGEPMEHEHVVLIILTILSGLVLFGEFILIIFLLSQFISENWNDYNHWLNDKF